MKTEKHDAIILSSNDEKTALKTFSRLLAETPIPEDELLANLGLFMTSKNLSRILFFYEIYKKIVDTHGIIMEFGVRWGQTLSILSAIRGILEPFNRHRKIVGFDTFEGFVGLSPKDGMKCKCQDGSFSVSRDYDKTLEQIMKIQEILNPVSHLRKFELVKGKADETIFQYFKSNPETLVSLAILDFDIYEPTKVALAAIKPRLFKGSVLVFDELCDEYFPGETLALLETFDLGKLRIQRSHHCARVSYLVVE